MFKRHEKCMYMRLVWQTYATDGNIKSGGETNTILLIVQRHFVESAFEYRRGTSYNVNIVRVQ